MDQEALLAEEIDAGAEFISQFDKFGPVVAALWLKSADSDRWYLLVAAEQIHRGNIPEGYREVVRLTNQMKSPYVNIFRIKLIPRDDLLVRDVVELQQRYPGKLPFRYRDDTLGSYYVDDAYIYAPSVPAARP